MKLTFIGFVLAIIALSACNSGNNTTTTNAPDTLHAKPVTVETYTPPAGVDAKVSASIKSIVDSYLLLKNALAADNGNDAASAGNHVLAALGSVDATNMTSDQKKTYDDIAADIKENAEHISENASKIEHQREHFEILSKDVEDLIRTFGGGQKLYKDFCPMANDKKGAFWISETKEIKNPYLGKEMPTCGDIREEII